MSTAVEKFSEAFLLFNRGDFFECHEVLEDLWQPLSPGPEKTFLQGLLQVGVAFHHWKNGNLTGARNLLTSGLAKLQTVHGNPAYQPPIPLEKLLIACHTLLETLTTSHHLPEQPLPEFPCLTCR